MTDHQRPLLLRAVESSSHDPDHTIDGTFLYDPEQFWQSEGNTNSKKEEWLIYELQDSLFSQLYIELDIVHGYAPKQVSFSLGDVPNNFHYTSPKQIYPMQPRELLSFSKRIPEKAGHFAITTNHGESGKFLKISFFGKHNKIQNLYSLQISHVRVYGNQTLDICWRPIIEQSIDASSTDSDSALDRTLDQLQETFWSSTGSENKEEGAYLVYQLLDTSYTQLKIRVTSSCGYSPSFLSFALSSLSNTSNCHWISPIQIFPSSGVADYTFPIKFEDRARYLRIDLIGRTKSESQKYYILISDVYALADKDHKKKQEMQNLEEKKKRKFRPALILRVPQVKLSKIKEN